MIESENQLFFSPSRACGGVHHVGLRSSFLLLWLEMLCELFNRLCWRLVARLLDRLPSKGIPVSKVSSADALVLEPVIVVVIVVAAALFKSFITTTSNALLLLPMVDAGKVGAVPLSGQCVCRLTSLSLSIGLNPSVLVTLTSTSCVMKMRSMLRRSKGQKTGRAATMVAMLTSRTERAIPVPPYQVGSNSG